GLRAALGLDPVGLGRWIWSRHLVGLRVMGAVPCAALRSDLALHGSGGEAAPPRRGARGAPTGIVHPSRRRVAGGVGLVPAGKREHLVWAVDWAPVGGSVDGKP